jgi:hypothetical protein
MNRNILWGIFGVGILVVAIVSTPSVLGKISPVLNNYLHPGPLSTLSQQMLMDIEADERGGESVMTDNMKSDGSVTVKTEDEAAAAFLKLRSAELATRPSNEDLKARIEQLRRTWGSEMSQRTVPADCQAAMQNMIDRLAGLAEADGKRLDVLQSFNPETGTHREMAEVARRSAQHDWEAIHAIDPTAVSPSVSDQWKNNPTSTEAAHRLVNNTVGICKEYWR